MSFRQCWENFAGLTSPEQLEEFNIKVDYRDVFNYFDVDKDGLLDQLELTNLFDAVRPVKDLEKGDILKRIEAVDKDSDGKVELDELEEILKSERKRDQLHADLSIKFETFKQARKGKYDLGTVSAVRAKEFFAKHYKVDEGRLIKIMDRILFKTTGTDVLFDDFLEVVCALLLEDGILKPAPET